METEVDISKAKLYAALHFSEYGYRFINQGVLTFHKWARYLPKPGADIVEFGCGNGWLCQLLAERGYQVTGVDIAVGDYTRYGYDFCDTLPTEQCDAVLSFDVLEHIPTPEIPRVLADIGKLAPVFVVSIGCYPTDAKIHETVMSPDQWLSELHRYTRMNWRQLEVFQRHTEFDSPVLVAIGRHGDDNGT